ncbi:MAG TPA: DUF6600 domain-containing protein, partial [Acidobacteriota bacterium]|nr:DUF6600 domain-containing protein [Acidobacteriota bacterium]
VNRDGRYTVRCGSWRAVTNREGLYRVHCEPEEEFWLAVRKGRARLTSERGEREVKAGEVVMISDPDNGTFASSHRYELDDLDIWNDRRDALYAGGLYAPESEDIRPGYYDLNLYGRWGYLSPYGRVWWPNVGHSWSPFRYGRWLNYPRWGWTWIGHEPWGWAPYHYGSWVYDRGFRRWCWVPSFKIWSPAIVNFYFGRGFIGWKPRGPRDPVHVERSRIVNIGSRIVDPHPDGITVIPRGDFISGRAATDRFLVPGESLATSLRPLQRDRIAERLAQSPSAQLDRSEASPTIGRAVPSRSPRVVTITPSRPVREARTSTTTREEGYTRPVPSFDSPSVSPARSFSERLLDRQTIQDRNSRITVPPRRQQRESLDIERRTPSVSRDVSPRTTVPRRVIPERRIVVPRRQEPVRPPASRIEPSRRSAPAPRSVAPSIQRSSPSRSTSPAPGRSGRTVRDR